MRLTANFTPAVAVLAVEPGLDFAHAAFYGVEGGEVFDDDGAVRLEGFDDGGEGISAGDAGYLGVWAGTRWCVLRGGRLCGVLGLRGRPLLGLGSWLFGWYQLTGCNGVGCSRQVE